MADRIMERAGSMDYFSIGPSFSFLGKGQHTTRIGVAGTLVLGIIGIYLSWLFGSDIYQRVYPSVNKSTNYIEMPGVIPFDKSKIPIAFGIQNYTGWAHYMDESLYVAYVHYYIVTKQKDPITKKPTTNITDFVMKAVPCSQDLFYKEDISDFINKMQMDQLYCVSNDGSTPLRLSGNYDVGLYESIVVQITTCEDDIKYSLVNMSDEDQRANKVPCRPQEEMKSLLDMGYFVMYFPDYQIDESNEKQPFRPFGRSVYSTISISRQKETQMTFKQMILDSDQGLVFEELETTSVYTMNNWRQMYVDSGSTMMWIQIEADQSQDHFTFQYLKIQDVIATVGGTLQICMIGIFILTMPFIEINYKSAFSNDYVTIIQQQEQQKLKNQIDIDHQQKQKIKQQTSDETNIPWYETNQANSSFYPLTLGGSMGGNELENSVRKRSGTNLGVGPNEIEDDEVRNSKPGSRVQMKIRRLESIEGARGDETPINNIKNASNLNYQNSSRGLSNYNDENVTPILYNSTTTVPPLNLLMPNNINEDLELVKSPMEIIQISEKNSRTQSRKNLPHTSMPINNQGSRINRIALAGSMSPTRNFRDQQFNEKKMTSVVQEELPSSSRNGRILSGRNGMMNNGALNTNLIKTSRKTHLVRSVIDKVQIERKTEKNKKFFTLSCLDYFRIAFPFKCWKNNTVKAYHFAQQFIESQLDVVNISKRLSELEQLKYLLFDRGERNLLKFLEFPTIKVIKGQEAEFVSIAQTQEEDNEVIENAFLKYCEILDRPEQLRTENENQLLQLVRPEFQKIFDSFRDNSEDYQPIPLDPVKAEKYQVDRYDVKNQEPMLDEDVDAHPGVIPGATGVTSNALAPTPLRKKSAFRRENYQFNKEKIHFENAEDQAAQVKITKSPKNEILANAVDQEPQIYLGKQVKMIESSYQKKPQNFLDTQSKFLNDDIDLELQPQTPSNLSQSVREPINQNQRPREIQVVSVNSQRGNQNGISVENDNFVGKEIE